MHVEREIFATSDRHRATRCDKIKLKIKDKYKMRYFRNSVVAVFTQSSEFTEEGFSHTTREF